MENNKSIGSISTDADNYVKRLLEDGAKSPVNTDDCEMHLPPWYDEKLFKKGQYYYHENKFAVFVGMLCGLIAVLSIPSIIKILICTRKSGTSMTAYRRYIKTIFHVIAWFRYDLKPNSKSWESLETVRKMHSTSSRYSEKANCGMITQKDMALTQFGFMGFVTLRAKELGAVGGDEFLNSTIHFWRVIGYMVGIKDEYNLCRDSWDDTKSQLEKVLVNVYRPYLTNTTNEFMCMTKALIEGLWSFMPFLTVKLYLFFTKRLAGCTGHRYLDSDIIEESGDNDELYKKLNGYNRYLLFSKVIIHQYLLKYDILRIYFNFQITLSEFLIYYFPFLAFHRFGFKNSYVRIFKKTKQT